MNRFAFLLLVVGIAACAPAPVTEVVMYAEPLGACGGDDGSADGTADAVDAEDSSDGTVDAPTDGSDSGDAVADATADASDGSVDPCAAYLPPFGAWDPASVSPVVDTQPSVTWIHTGQSVAIAVDPFVSSTVWLGTGEKGLWRSDLCGAAGTWHLASTGTNSSTFNGSTIWSMVVDPVARRARSTRSARTVPRACGGRPTTASTGWT
jgi:hypothetical protein